MFVEESKGRIVRGSKVSSAKRLSPTMCGGKYGNMEQDISAVPDLTRV